MSVDKIKNKNITVNKTFFDDFNSARNNNNNYFSHMQNAGIESISLELTPINDVKIDKLKQIMGTGTESDAEALDALYKSFEIEIAQGNNEAKQLLDTLIKIKTKFPDISYKVCGDNCSNYNSYTREVSISNIDLNNPSTIFHETGHMLHDVITNENIPEDFGIVLSKSKSNVNVQKIVDEFYKHDMKCQTEAINRYYININNKYGLNSTQCFNSLKSKYQKALNNPLYGVTMAISSDLPEDIKNEIYSWHDNLYNIKHNVGYGSNTTKLSEYLASQEMWSSVYSIKEDLLRESGVTALEDIIDAVYSGEFYDNEQYTTNGEYLAIYGHGSEYYNIDLESNNNFEREYMESIANFTQLKLTGNEEGLDKIKKMFGEDFYNSIEQTYNQFLNYKER